MSYDNQMKGVLFRNDKKEKDSHPDYKGSARVDNADYWLAAWVRESKSGSKYLSLKFETKEGEEPKPVHAIVTNDEIPF